MEISAKTAAHPEAVKASYDMPETYEGLVEKFGSEAVGSAARAQFVISLQAYMRRHIDKPADELQSLVTNWAPDQRTPATKKSAFEKAKGALGSLSAEERAALLAQLQAGN